MRASTNRITYSLRRDVRYSLRRKAFVVRARGQGHEPRSIDGIHRARSRGERGVRQHRVLAPADQGARDGREILRLSIWKETTVSRRFVDEHIVRKTRGGAHDGVLAGLCSSGLVHDVLLLVIRFSVARGLWACAPHSPRREVGIPPRRAQLKLLGRLSFCL